MQCVVDVRLECNAVGHSRATVDHKHVDGKTVSGEQSTTINHRYTPISRPYRTAHRQSLHSTSTVHASLQRLTLLSFLPPGLP